MCREGGPAKLFSAQLDMQFLDYRRDFLISQGSSTGKLLDPITNLQCLPSVDVAVLNLSLDCLKYIRQESINYFRLYLKYENSYSSESFQTDRELDEEYGKLQPLEATSQSKRGQKT